MRKLVNGIWVTELRSPDGAMALIADHGAHVLSWKPVDGQEALYLSEQSKFGGNNAIRGGVPIIFPQFGARGSGKRHGFARLLVWHHDFSGVEQGCAVARFRLNTEDALDFKWPHRFELLFEVSVSAQQLKMGLTVHNPSEEAWEFCAALHTYLSVSNIANIDIEGLQSNSYVDQVAEGTCATQDVQSLRIDTEVDRIYRAVQMPLTLHDRSRDVIIRKQGFSDVVIWNPWQAKAALMSDMAAQDYCAFVCVEAGAIDQAVVLGAGESWSGSQSILIKNN